MQIRRILAATNAQGQAHVVADGAAPRQEVFEHLPGHSATLLWATSAQPSVGAQAQATDPTPTASFVPGPGESRLLLVTFPPDSVMLSATFDAMAFGAEFVRRMPDLAQRFEPDHPGMHATDSIDYDVLLDGELVLELDDGQTVALRQHDVVVQQGNRHAWRNPGTRPATLLCVLLGAQRQGGIGG